MPSLPDCCTPSEAATVAELLYCAYNAGGPADRAGLNYQGLPCPTWADLPADGAVRAKWEAVADLATKGVTEGSDDLPRLAPLFDFGLAICALKAGKRVRRSGWNGKGMWLALTEGSRLSPAPTANLHGAARALVIAEDPSWVVIGAHIDMRAADGTLVIGWLASQTDMLATDWEIVE